MKILGFWLLSMIYMCSNSTSSEDYKLESNETYELAETAYNDVEIKSEPSINAEEQNIEQKIIKTGNLRFETQDLAETRAQILDAVIRSKAYIQDERSGKDYRGSYQELHLRIPTQNFQQALDDISQGISFFDEKSISQRDVTEEFIDLEARLKAKRELENRYMELLKKANSVKEILEIERELSVIREEIEAKQGRLNYLSKQVSYSTLKIHFYKTEVNSGVTQSYGSKMLQALKGGWQGISSFLLGILYIWPFLVLIILTILLIRLWRKRKSDKNQD